MKKLARVLAVVVVLLLATLAAAVGYLHRAEPDPAADAVLPGLAAPVQVWRDSLGVPQLWAGSEADLFRALGYVHAQDRLWQMELLRRVADGRLAEVIGPRLVDSDRFLRTLALGRAAAENERRLDPATRALLQAYGDGVNAWIRTRPTALPPEFLALRFTPEPWTVRNSLAIGKIMAWDLAAWQTGLDLQYAADVVGATRAAELAPRYPAWGPRILPDSSTARGSAGVPARTDGIALSRISRFRIPEPARQLLEGASIARASNAWVIEGSRTRSGKPILANDMHLALRAPSLWYLAALHGGALNVVGMTIPGVPVVIAGHTPRVAWGFSNAMVDDADFFVEQLDPADASRYRTPTGWARLAVRSETIRVRGAAPVVQRVRTSRHGPVLSDVEPRAGARVLAMRWTGQDPSSEVTALLAMNRARTAAEFRTALRSFDSPHQNVVFADADGRIGYQMTGTVPVRRSGDGLLPVPGWTGAGDWLRLLKPPQLPGLLDPAEGFIVTANNPQLGPGSPLYVSNHYAPPYRALRIQEMIERGDAFTADDVARQQMDVRDLSALRYLPRAVAAAREIGNEKAARLLASWNGDARADSRAAAMYYLWFEALRRLIGADEYGARPMYFPREALERILDTGDSPWVDDVRTPARRETLPELSAAAMREAVRGARRKRWGALHRTSIEHALGTVNALDRALGLNIGPFPSGGSPNTVNVAGWDGTRPPFTSTNGPSQRHVVDLAAPDYAGGFILPGGQSGIPVSPHYRDQLPRWRAGRLWRIPLDRRKAAARTVARMTLQPR